MFTALLSLALLADAPSERPKDEYLYLFTHFDADVFAPRKAPPDDGGDFDGAKDPFPADALPEGTTFKLRSSRFGDVVFLRPKTAKGERNALSLRGQTIRVRTKNRFNVLLSLGAAHRTSDTDPARGRWGWVELSFTDGSSSRTPIGFSVWTGEPVFGEESAIDTTFGEPMTADAIGVGPFIDEPLTDGGRRGAVPEGSPIRLFLQRSPLPADKVLSAITLPSLPGVKLVALTLAHRDGVSLPPSAPPPGPAPEPASVAVFSEPGFPALDINTGITPEAIRDRIEKAGIRCALLRFDHLLDRAVFNPERFPVLVQPYGSAFPLKALDALRAYRKAGGAMVHCGAPFTVSAEHNPYRGWILHSRPREGGQEVLRTLGLETLMMAAHTRFGPTKALRDWGLGDLSWGQCELRDLAGLRASPVVFSARRSIAAEGGAAVRGADEPELIPLLGLGSWDSYLAFALRHRVGEHKGALDVVGPTTPIWRGDEREEPEAALEIAARGAAWCLKEKGRISAEEWTELAKPAVLAEPRSEARFTAPREDPFDSLPRAEKLSGKVAWVDLSGLTSAEKVLFASLQGLLAASGRALYLAEQSAEKGWIDFLVEKKSIESVEKLSPSAALDLLGHRRAVVVDPDIRGALNVATMVAAVEGLLVAYPGLVEPYRLEVAADPRGTFDDEAEMLAWAIANLKPRLNASLLACIPTLPDTWALRDYLIRHRVFTLWPLPSKESTSMTVAKGDMLRAELLRTPLLTTVVGVDSLSASPIETFFARHGMRWLSLDGSANLTLYERIEPRGGRKKAASPRDLKVEEGKVYLAVAYDAPRRSWFWAAEETRFDPGTAEVIPLGTPLFEFDEVIGPASRLAPTLTSLSLPGGVERLSPAHWDLVLDSLPDAGTLGLSFPESLDLGCFGSALGAARKEAVEHLVRAAAKEMERRGLAYLHLHPNADFDSGPWQEALRSLPARTGVLHAFDPSGPPRDLLTACSLAGEVPVFHDPGATRLRDLLSSQNLDLYRPLLPAFVFTSLESYASARGETPLDERVVVVRADELVQLARGFFARRRAEAVEVVPAGAVWKYHDKGSDLKQVWRQPTYDDSAWPEGKAELGYGDAAEGRPEATVLSQGAASARKHPCTYFRRTFDAAPRSDWRLLILEVLADDGCIAYLNGEEVLRFNLPEGEVGFGQYTQSALGSGVETAWQRKALTIGKLREGRNTLAVEVHQSGPGSSDLSFDLRLAAYRWRFVDPGKDAGKTDK